MKYYVTVSRFKSTTKLGTILTEILYNRYNNALISYKEALTIPKFIESEVERLVGENRFYAPLKVFATWDYHKSALLPGQAGQVHATSEAAARSFEAKRPFNIYLSPVRVDYTELETEPIKKGGAE